MGFGNQLKLLLWKNFTLRKRQPVRVAIEIIWPLTLFLILVLVKTRRLNEALEECHLDGKAMPSAGALAFFQGIICGWNNTCHANVTPDEIPGGLANFNNSQLSIIFQDIEMVLSNNSQVDAVADLIEDFEILNNVQNLLMNGRARGSIRVGNLFVNPEVIQATVARQGIAVTPEVISDILNASLSLQTIQNISLANLGFTSILGSASWSWLENRAFVCNETYINSIFVFRNPDEVHLVREQLCNLSQADLNQFVTDFQNQFSVFELVREISEFARNNTGRALNIADEVENVIPRLTNIFSDVQDLESLQKLFGDLTNIFNETVQAVAQSRATNDSCQPQQPANNILFSAPILKLMGTLICGREDGLMGLLSGGGNDPTGSLGGFLRTTSNQNAQTTPAPTPQECVTRATPENTTESNTNRTMGFLSFFADINMTMNETEFCEKEVFGVMQSNKYLKALWRQIKPMVNGKILYAPDTPATRKIMTRAGAFFTDLGQILTLAKDWLDYSPRLTQYLATSPNIDIIRNVLNATNSSDLTGPAGFLYSILSSNPQIRNFNWTVWAASPTRKMLVKYLSKENITDYHWRTSIKYTDALMKVIWRYVGCFEFDKFEAHATEADAVKRSLKLIESSRFWAAVIFDNLDEDNPDVIPNHITYRLRLNKDKVDSTKKITDKYWRPKPRRSPITDLKYVTFGFAYIQDLVEHAIMDEITGNDDRFGVYLQQFPYPCYIVDKFTFAISRSMPMFMVLAWVYSAAMIVKGIVHEKERRLKEVMKMMGLGNGVHWLAWFINSFVLMLITIILLSIILKYGKVLEHSDPTVLFVFLLAFTIATISQCFLFSVFFSKANLAAVCGGFLYFISYLPYTQLIQWEDQLTTGAKGIACLLSTVSFGLGCSYFARYEEQAVGIQWSNVGSSPVPDDEWSMAHCIVMMLVDAVIYWILTWYIEAVFPGDIGIPRPWYFPATKSYWCGTQVKSSTGYVGAGTGSYDVPQDYELGNRQEGSEDFETEPRNLPMGVSIQNMKKAYKNGKKVAVDGLSLNFYEGQITSFLGHNGAGKTTTMSVLTGLFPPTSGSAFIYGKDIRFDMDIIRKSLGMCPQYNVLFDCLTVEEHLWFYACLKGMNDADVQDEMQRMIQDVGLPHKRKEESKNLSGGMKRKLSVAIAFVGGSKTVILDEPTAGVDPYARRAIWDLLLKYRKGRTIILSTHHMDEADILGDRIAIISLGKLCCCGSSLFLKSRYGNGYYLTMVKDKEQWSQVSRPGTALSERTLRNITTELTEENLKPLQDEKDEGVADLSDKSDNSPNSSQSPTPPPEIERGASACTLSTDAILTFIQKYIPNAVLVEDIGTELSFQLPQEGVDTSAFQRFFQALEENQAAFGITSYGVSDTTLEEVFLKVAEDSGLDAEQDEQTRETLEQYSEGGNYPRPITRLSFRKKKLGIFDRERENNININDERELLGDTESVISIPISTTSESTLSGYGAGSIKVKGFSLLKNQFKALFIKRFHHVRRSKKGFVCEIILPAIFICLSMIFSKIVPGLSPEPPLELQPWMYTPIKGDQHLNVFYTNDAPGTMYADKLESILRSQVSLGTRCMNTSVYTITGHPCSPLKSSTPWTPSPKLTGNLSIDSPSCSCDTGNMQCPAGAGGPVGSNRIIDTTDRLINMTGRNLSDWLVKTNMEYVKRRYGGYSFGDTNDLDLVNTTQLYGIFERLATAANGGNPVNGQESVWMEMERIIGDLATQNNVKVWFNNKGWAAMVSYMNGMNNLLLRAKLPPGMDPANYGITAINHPMEATQEQLTEDSLNTAWISVLVAIAVIFAMSFIPASFVLYLIEERVSNSKHLQFVSGVNPSIYWISQLLWDILNYTVPMILCVFIFLAFGEKAYVSETNAPCLIVLLFLYGWAMIPMMFPFSWLFSVPSSAFVALACVNIFLGITSTVATYILEFFPDDEELKNINDILRQVFLVLPHYCLGRGLIDMATNQLLSDAQSIYIDDVEVPDPFAWDSVGRNLFSLAVQGLVWFIIVLLIEYKFFCKSRATIPPNLTTEDEDVDVAEERKRVMSGRAQNDMLRLENLTKVFRRTGKGKLVAVDQLCLGVPKGECFGLLGVNGAGKTTTFKMLTGDESVTKGNAYLDHHSILTDMNSVHQNLGYCPQFDALDPLLTGREHLEFYARLRGVESDEVEMVAEYCVRKLGLLPYATRKSEDYSGGNKRKLSTAIALIGNPPVIFLDEPTTGMDPRARRFLWNCIISIVKDGRSVILTSHSMEECEALCGRIGIMVNGSFKCIGSVQHLKNRFGDGYTVILRVKGQNPDMQPVKQFLSNTFPNAVLKEQHHNMLQYQLPSEGLSLANLFGICESVREEFQIEDYSVNQTTLDQVFINFAKLQTDLLEDELGAVGDAQLSGVKPHAYTEDHSAHHHHVSSPPTDTQLPEVGYISHFDSFVNNSTPSIARSSTELTSHGMQYDEESLAGSTVELVRPDSARSNRSSMPDVV